MMDFDLTQHLLVAFLRNNTDLTRFKQQQHDHHHHVKRQNGLSNHDHRSAITRGTLSTMAPPPADENASFIHSFVSRLSLSTPPQLPSPIILLPTPERLQSEPQAQLNHDSDSDSILYNIFQQTRDHSPDQFLPNGSWLDNTFGDTDSTVSQLDLWDFIIGIFMAIVTLATVIGNALVILAILRERHLRSVGNYLVFSLAVADLMVACLVMPLGALYVVTGEWTLGAALCDLWTIADVLCCTASILHLLAIAMVSAISISMH